MLSKAQAKKLAISVWQGERDKAILEASGQFTDKKRKTVYTHQAEIDALQAQIDALKALDKPKDKIEVGYTEIKLSMKKVEGFTGLSKNDYI